MAIVSIGVGVHRAVEAASQLAGEGVEAAVLDLRSVAPLDRDAVLDLARQTNRVLVVDEDYQRGGLSGEVAAVIAESDVSARFGRVTTESTIPYARALEEETLPNVPRILAAARMLLSRPAGPGACQADTFLALLLLVTAVGTGAHWVDFFLHGPVNVVDV